MAKVEQRHRDVASSVAKFHESTRGALEVEIAQALADAEAEGKKS